MSITGFFRRLRHDLAREIVVFICSLVLMALFLYIFNDFLNVEIASLSKQLQSQVGFVFALAVLILSSILGGKLIRRETNQYPSLMAFAAILGTKTTHLKQYLALRSMTLIVVTHGASWWIASHFFFPLQNFALFLSLELPMLALSLIIGQIRFSPVALVNPQSDSSFISKALLTLDDQPKKAITMLQTWRLGQILRRNRPAQMTLLSGAFICASTLAVSFKSAPYFFAVLLSLSGGILGSFAIAFQLAEDLNFAWVERFLGISHEDFVRSYQKIAYKLGGTFAILTILCYGLPIAFKEASLDLSVYSEILKLGFIAFMPFVLMPMLFMQIDGRRPAIQALLVILAGLFIGTAIYASWLGAVLIYFLKYYATQSQMGRFYRA